MNWFGELAVRSVSEFAVDGIPLVRCIGSVVRPWAPNPRASCLELVRELEHFLFLLPPDPFHTRRPRNTRDVRLNTNEPRTNEMFYFVGSAGLPVVPGCLLEA